MNEKQIAKILVSKLQDMGFVVHRYDAILNSSVPVNSNDSSDFISNGDDLPF